MRRTLFIVCAVVTMLWSTASNATSLSSDWADFQKVRAEGSTSHILDIENDSLLLNHADGFYTSGLVYTQRSVLQESDRSNVVGWRLGHEMYTASDIKLRPEEITAPDHPYAAWAYAGMFKETHRNDGSSFSLGVDLGCLGPCAGGEWVQTNLHRLLNQPLPESWRTQVRNEFGAVLYADIAPVRLTPLPWLDATPHLKGRFGNIFTDVGAGLTLRAGRLNLLPDQATLHGFVRLDARAVAYDATLQGGYFSKQNPYTVQPKRLLGEAELGLVWNRAPQ
ncbi:MAG: lipid A deacylase LpxR family protein [Pseudomonadota bacterium]